MTSDAAPQLFTIPAGLPFLDRLAAALVADPSLGGTLGAPGANLADLTILLPTRRAARALADAFMTANQGAPLLLPRIQPLGDVDEEELLLDPGQGISTIASGDLSLTPAIPGLERQLLLAQLILKWAEGTRAGPRDPAQALLLAAELARLLDAAETEQVDLTRLQTLVPADYAENWQLTLEFLVIVTENWPAILATRHQIDPATRRNLLLDAQATAWANKPPAHPVLAAGSTGSIPASANLLRTVAHLPAGAVVLPGLDLGLEEPSWQRIEASHPQFAMKELLTQMGADRDQVALWPGAGEEDPTALRARLVNEALRPWSTTDGWAGALVNLGSEQAIATAMDGLTIIHAPTLRDEAAIIALKLRGLLETEGRTGALVTPDRDSARRVATELKRWDIDIDDSAGTPLDRTEPVTFLRLIAAAAVEDLAPVPLLALLSHPLTAAGLDPAACRRLARTLNRHVLRGARPAPGCDGLRLAFKEARGETTGQTGAAVDWQALDHFVDRLEAALGPLLSLMERSSVPVSDMVDAHLRAGEALAASSETAGAGRLWTGEAGEAAALFASELRAAADNLAPLAPVAYPNLFDVLTGPRKVRARYGRHPRLFIWGPLEARLQQADLMILGGLNEGTWPAEAAIDPWLSRPMRADLGLSPPERRIGLAAHDFAQGACVPEVCLTRSLKVDGAPTVASRWLLRLENLLAPRKTSEPAADTWTAWVEAIDRPLKIAALAAPRACPPLIARPDRFSVTEIETLIRDPYAIYAKRVLKLEPLEPLDSLAGALERGTLVHKALEIFTKAHPKDLPPDLAGRLIEVGEGLFADAPDRPGVAAFWWPRFVDIAYWLADLEPSLRATAARTLAECPGQMVLEEGLTRAVTLVAKADRIGVGADGHLTIYDYKTGVVPSKPQVDAGLAPQLPLEAAIAATGGFDGVPAGGQSALVYLRLTGGDPAGEVKPVSDGDEDLAAVTLAGLLDLLGDFENPTTPYLARPRPAFIGRPGRYDHLARVKEWSAGARANDGGAEGGS